MQNKPVWKVGSREEDEVSGFFVSLDKVRVNECPARLKHPAVLEKGEKLLWKYEETRSFVSFIWSDYLYKLTLLWRLEPILSVALIRLLVTFKV